jgi:hypothetical protein
MSDNNTDPVIIWRLRWREKRGQEKRKYQVHLFFRNNLNSGTYIVSKELNQNRELFKSFYQMSIECFSLLVDLVGPQIRRKDTKFFSRRKTTGYSQVRKVCLFIAIHYLQISKQIPYYC